MTLPKSFMVFDDNGNIWPPGFVSQIFPADPTQVVVERSGLAASQRATATRERALAEDRAQGSGHIEGLTKKRPNGMTDKAKLLPAKKPRRFKFNPMMGEPSPAEAVWNKLRALPPDTQMQDEQIALWLRMSGGAQVRQRLQRAVNAGVLEAVRRGKNCHYSLGPTVPAAVASKTNTK